MKTWITVHNLTRLRISRAMLAKILNYNLFEGLVEHLFLKLVFFVLYDASLYSIIYQSRYYSGRSWFFYLN